MNEEECAVSQSDLPPEEPAEDNSEESRKKEEDYLGPPHPDVEATDMEDFSSVYAPEQATEVSP